MHHNPRKRFGQNFLVDQHIIAQIVAEIYPQKSDRIIEIGPGLGALTRPLLQALDHLHVIEIDRDIVSKLNQAFTQEELTIHSADALKFDFSALGSKLRIVGNLPYNISTPLLFHLSQFSEHILDMHFMLQKEVVDRMVGSPATADYGRLSVMLQYRFDMEYVFSVPAESFRPVPKVESAIVRMIPRDSSARIVKDEALFSQIVTAAFSQRRKTLRNTLQQHLTASDFSALGIDPGLRAENLSVEEFAAIANFLS
ncbi:16S rRNA (adenine(1518)-N(6)/adenine(1519)-N(6))-dimethyltransferase RsmA [Nitrosomonas oligotropha]|uniref:16S rRNA (adenine(1518)-N(6)/adenine(1519)-N(6))- dimethyltransferase RsmA n=1 Tax=Nitrosomonas oligotropha TaxID=42354 RepID=UPI00136F9F94|nr:16S rRNA (adenine(1518)-N(6)/adenine(1519)-N(6))-dimethyltransferase RsmA [Nitrosomonas oligotropha]MXS83617.1 16S rRNA (adenine(1518)-N(6)/adenine(1519)-N(6))-dimethyltransferase RsmA [Nitrosomonas oligotropha]